MRPTGGAVHLMRTHDFILLPFPPPLQGLLRRPALSLKHIFHCKLLVFVPAHLERLAVVGVDQVEDGLIVDLDEGNEHLVCLIRRRSLAYLQEKLADRLGNDALNIRVVASFNGIGLS